MNEVPPSDEIIKATRDRFEKLNCAINTDDILKDYTPSLWYRFSEWVEEKNPFGKSYFDLTSVEEYIKLPYRKRHVWLFWYKEMYLASGGYSIFGRKSEREKLEKLISSRYPIQHFLREHGRNLRFKISRGYDALRYFFNPRQKWLTKQIPNSWADKVWLISELNFAMVVHFVDGEKCFKTINYEGSSDAHAIFAKELKECYNYIKIIRPKLTHEFENSYPKEGEMTGDYEVDYAKHNLLETQIDKEDTKWLVWIVTNRDFFWT